MAHKAGYQFTIYDQIDFNKNSEKQKLEAKEKCLKEKIDKLQIQISIEESTLSSFDRNDPEERNDYNTAELNLDYFKTSLSSTKTELYKLQKKLNEYN